MNDYGYAKKGALLLKNQNAEPPEKIREMLIDITHYARENVENTLDFILFVSYARGDESEDSDIDILVLMNDDRSPYWLMKEFLETDEYAMEKYGLITNFLPFNEQRYNDPVNFGLARNIWKDGIRIC